MNDKQRRDLNETRFNDFIGPLAWRLQLARELWAADPCAARAVVTQLHARALFAPDGPCPDEGMLRLLDASIHRFLGGPVL